MASKKKGPTPDEIAWEARVKEIRASARSGTHWADEVEVGPACVCGAFLEGSTVTSWGDTVEKGRCYRHGVTRGSRIAQR